MADTKKPTRLSDVISLGVHPVDPALAERSARMTVLVEHGKPLSLQDNFNFGVGGTGGVFHYARNDGSVARYIITNNHNVAEGTSAPNADLPQGIAAGGQVYNVFYDRDGSPGLARLVKHGMFHGDEKIDQAILQILDATHDRAEMRTVLSKIDPKLVQQLDQGMPVFSANPASSSIDTIREPGGGSGQYQLSGYPGGIKSDAALNLRDELEGAASIQQLETASGNYIQVTPANFLLTPTNGAVFRHGYSGSIVFDQQTGQPMAILHSAAGRVPVNGKQLEIDFASSLTVAAQEIRRIEEARARGEHVTVGIANTAIQGFASQTWAQNPYQLQGGLQAPPPVMVQLPSGVTHDPMPVSGSDLMTLPAPQASVPLPRIEVKRDGEGR